MHRPLPRLMFRLELFAVDVYVSALDALVSAAVFAVVAFAFA